MKRVYVTALTILLAISLCACGSMNSAPTTVPKQTRPSTFPSTNPSTVPSTIKPMDPTVETNIPDPSVDTSELFDSETGEIDTAK